MLNALLDLIAGKPKEKARPEPTCYLFIGEHQCIGGYETPAQAFAVIKSEETIDCFVASDMQGESVLYQWQEKREYLTCGCEYKTIGWHNGSHFVSPYSEQRTNYCGDDELHNPAPISPATGYASALWVNGGLSFRHSATRWPSGEYRLVDRNGDPLF